MAVLFVSVVAAVATSVLSEPLLEQALAHTDECDGSDGETTCALHALQLRGQKQASSSACMPQDQWCGNSYAEKDCCGSNTCVRSGGIFKCKSVPDPQRQCMNVGQVCGGPGQLKETCCGTALCQGYVGNILKCVEQQPQCRNVGQVCGGPGQRTQACCGTAICQKDFYGGDTLRCAFQQPQCMNVGQACGGPGQQTQACCGTAICQKDFFGGSTLKCVEQQPQCVKVDQVCGGPGQQTQACCGTAICQRFVDGKLRCVPDQPACASHAGPCGKGVDCCSGAGTCSAPWWNNLAQWTCS